MLANYAQNVHALDFRIIRRKTILPCLVKTQMLTKNAHRYLAYPLLKEGWGPNKEEFSAH